ncbi:MAG: hypothetical protein KIT43_14195 [Bauldia sp.]|nr:hypothetical protein [Bauldia sp.]MCW5716672.1 hypothetical protein [Bauldia sp.]
MAFEIILVRDLAARFAQRRNFIGELEAILPLFYEQVGQRLKAWQTPAPRLKEEKSDAESVSPEAIAQQAEAAARAEEGWVERPAEAEVAPDDGPSGSESSITIGAGVERSPKAIPSPATGDGTT